RGRSARGPRMTGRVRVAAGFLAVTAVVALGAPVLAPWRPDAQLDIIALQNQPPSWHHWMGTDVLGRDVLSRVIYGARVSLGVGVLAALVAVTVGTLVGAAAGYFRRATDGALMRIVDVGLAIPRIFLVLAIIAVGGSLSPFPLALFLGLTGWFATSRLV